MLLLINFALFLLFLCVCLCCRFKSSVDSIVANSLHNWLSFDQVKFLLARHQILLTAESTSIWSVLPFLQSRTVSTSEKVGTVLIKIECLHTQVL